MIGFVVADLLFQAFEDQPEGVLTRLRSNVVRKQTLAKIARSLKLSDYLLLGEGENKSGGFLRDSILCDCLESVMAAIYLDSDINQVTKVITHIFTDTIDQLDPSRELKDPKSVLQEWLQSKKYDLPAYRILAISGEDHDQTFEVECATPLIKTSVKAKGSSRRKAEQKAAGKMLKKLEASKKDE